MNGLKKIRKVPVMLGPDVVWWTIFSMNIVVNTLQGYAQTHSYAFPVTYFLAREDGASNLLPFLSLNSRIIIRGREGNRREMVGPTVSARKIVHLGLQQLIRRKRIFNSDTSCFSLSLISNVNMSTDNSQNSK
jgi:hypothetical protein